ncbi:hypothetical protein MPTK2_7g07200 [Marchantia polymorpha subsp. ruderalis]
MGSMALAEGEEEDVSTAGRELMDEFNLALRDPAKLSKFVARGADVPEEVWRKALLWACAAGQVEFVAEFLNNSPLNSLVNTAVDDDEYTALHRAVVGKHLEVARLLSRLAFNLVPMLHAKTRRGWTALHLAVCANNVEMVDLLLAWYQRDDFCNTEYDFEDTFLMTPLQYAVLDHKSDVVHRLATSETFRRHLNKIDSFRRSALHMACSLPDANVGAVVAELLDATGVDPNAVDCCKYTPLHWAVLMGAAESVEHFISRATKKRIRTTEVDCEGRAVLQIAIENREIDRKVGRDLQKMLQTVPEVKDEVERLYRDRQVFVDAANAILVGAALIASVSFGGWLQPPQGDDQEMRVFWAFNSLSFFFSLATVTAGAGTVLPMSDVYIGHSVTSIRRWLALTSCLLLVSVVLVLGAFVAAGFASLPAVPRLHVNMVTTTCIGTVVCCVIGLLFLERMSKIRALADFQLLFGRLRLPMRSIRRRSLKHMDVEQLDEDLETDHDHFATRQCRERARRKDTAVRKFISSSLCDKETSLLNENMLFYSSVSTFDEWNV